MADYRFSGQIAGVGSASGVRVVVGWWRESPLGEFADVMVETAQHKRLLLAPSGTVADFVARTYTFDEIRIEPVTATRDAARWRLRTPSLTLDLALGRRRLLGWLLQAVPGRLATAPAFTAMTDPVARVAMRGVRTRGAASLGRQEFYAATDVRAVTSLAGSLEGQPLGELAPVDPPCHFGFSSTPRAPSVTSVTTTVRVDGQHSWI